MLLLMKGESSNGKCGSKNNGKKGRSLRDDKQRAAMEDARSAISQGVANLMARGSAFAFPGAWVDWVVLPLLAAAYEEHDEAEDEHDGSPGEIEVDAHGFLVDVGGIAGEETVESHEAADEQEDEAEGDADVESHENSRV
jgi:hypothetical protein